MLETRNPAIEREDMSALSATESLLFTLSFRLSVDRWRAAREVDKPPRPSAFVGVVELGDAALFLFAFCLAKLFAVHQC